MRQAAGRVTGNQRVVNVHHAARVSETAVIWPPCMRAAADVEGIEFHKHVTLSVSPTITSSTHNNGDRTWGGGCEADDAGIEDSRGSPIEVIYGRRRLKSF